MFLGSVFGQLSPDTPSVPALADHQCLPGRVLQSRAPALGLELHRPSVEGALQYLWRQVALWLFWSKSTWLAV